MYWLLEKFCWFIKRIESVLLESTRSLMLLEDIHHKLVLNLDMIKRTVSLVSLSIRLILSSSFMERVQIVIVYLKPFLLSLFFLAIYLHSFIGQKNITSAFWIPCRKQIENVANFKGKVQSCRRSIDMTNARGGHVPCYAMWEKVDSTKAFDKE